ncbi:MAG: tetratricopeptide repeat protein [Pseudomonadota bacterium]
MMPRTLTLLLLSSLCAWGARAADETLIQPIQEEWALVKYQVPEKQQGERYHDLARRAGRLAESHPGSAEALIWEGIVLSSEAGAKGGLGALSLAKEARQRFEAALKLDERALQGSAYTSLGSLYYKVPGWPIGFGDKAKAENLLKKALAINPDGIDANFFYADFLTEQDRYAEARRHLDTALKAAPRPGREMADSGRRQEIQALLAKVRKNLEN